MVINYYVLLCLKSQDLCNSISDCSGVWTKKVAFLMYKIGCVAKSKWNFVNKWHISLDRVTYVQSVETVMQVCCLGAEYLITSSLHTCLIYTRFCSIVQNRTSFEINPFLEYILPNCWNHKLAGDATFRHGNPFIPWVDMLCQRMFKGEICFSHHFTITLGGELFGRLDLVCLSGSTDYFLLCAMPLSHELILSAFLC